MEAAVRGADINARDKKSASPLHVTVAASTPRDCEVLA